MTISNTSYFRRPPVMLEPKQVIAFNGITYSIDICDLAFQRLQENLYFSSYPEGCEIRSTAIFSDVWTIISNATIFQKLVSTQFKIDKRDLLFQKLVGIDALRNSNQHIDERIDEVILDNELPIYGSISWYSREHEQPSFGKVISLDSGSFSYKKQITMKPVNPVGRSNQQLVSAIEFTSVIKENLKFVQKTIDLNDLMEGLKFIVDFLEKQINDQLVNKEPLERHSHELSVTLYTRKVISEVI